MTLLECIGTVSATMLVCGVCWKADVAITTQAYCDVFKKATDKHVAERAILVVERDTEKECRNLFMAYVLRLRFAAATGKQEAIRVVVDDYAATVHAELARIQASREAMMEIVGPFMGARPKSAPDGPT